MKKQYMNPEITIVKIQTIQMIASSPLDTSGATPQQADFTEYTPDTDGNLSRGGRGFWDDEDEY